MSPARNVMPATESARVTDTPTSTLPVDPAPEEGTPARTETERELDWTAQISIEAAIEDLVSAYRAEAA